MFCPNCTKEMHHWIDAPIDAKRDVETPFNVVVRCDRCGLGAIDPQPQPAEVAALYDLPSYYTHGESHIRPVASNVFDRILVHLAWRADRAYPFDPAEIAQRLPVGGTVLDIGCGDGETLEAFRALGFQVLGVDPDPRSRARAAERDLTVLDGTAERLPAAIDCRRFDLAIMTHALEHCLDPARALANLAAVTAPSGWTYVEVPNAGCLHFRTFLQCSEMFDAPRHLWFFTPAALEQSARGAGLRVREWRHAGYTRYFHASWRTWEREIHARLRRHSPRLITRDHTRLRAFGLLLRTALAGRARKYDSMGVLATPAAAG